MDGLNTNCRTVATTFFAVPRQENDDAHSQDSLHTRINREKTCLDSLT